VRELYVGASSASGAFPGENTHLSMVGGYFRERQDYESKGADRNQVSGVRPQDQEPAEPMTCPWN
jgi:hypothetical protein